MGSHSFGVVLLSPISLLFVTFLIFNSVGHIIAKLPRRNQARGKCGKCATWLSIQAFAKWLYCHSFVTTRAKWPRKKHFPAGSRGEPSGASIGRTSVTV